MIDTAHHEKHFENYIVSQLERQGWQVGDTSRYDTERALYPDDLVAWLEATQPDKWSKLQNDNRERALDVLMDRLAKAIGRPQRRDYRVGPGLRSRYPRIRAAGDHSPQRARRAQRRHPRPRRGQSPALHLQRRRPPFARPLYPQRFRPGPERRQMAGARFQSRIRGSTLGGGRVSGHTQRRTHAPAKPYL